MKIKIEKYDAGYEIECARCGKQGPHTTMEYIVHLCGTSLQPHAFLCDICKDLVTNTPDVYMVFSSVDRLSVDTCDVCSKTCGSLYNMHPKKWASSFGANLYLCPKCLKALKVAQRRKIEHREPSAVDAPSLIASADTGKVVAVYKERSS